MATACTPRSRPRPGGGTRLTPAQMEAGPDGGRGQTHSPSVGPGPIMKCASAAGLALGPRCRSAPRRSAYVLVVRGIVAPGPHPGRARVAAVRLAADLRLRHVAADRDVIAGGRLRRPGRHRVGRRIRVRDLPQDASRHRAVEHVRAVQPGRVDRRRPVGHRFPPDDRLLPGRRARPPLATRRAPVRVAARARGPGDAPDVRPRGPAAVRGARRRPDPQPVCGSGAGAAPAASSSTSSSRGG